jgi:hypothetical protein
MCLIASFNRGPVNPRKAWRELPHVVTLPSWLLGVLCLDMIAEIIWSSELHATCFTFELQWAKHSTAMGTRIIGMYGLVVGVKVIESAGTWSAIPAIKATTLRLFVALTIAMARGTIVESTVEGHRCLDCFCVINCLQLVAWQRTENRRPTSWSSSIRDDRLCACICRKE